ncbi:hypothetical protein COOONC_00448 [Cooperia oncophora]
MAMQGRNSYLYRHDLVALSQKNLTLRISKPINRVPEKYIPKKLAISVRLPETKGVLQCTTSHGDGPQAGAVFLCCCTPSAVLLFQWYEPLNKFLLVRSAELNATTRFPLSPFKVRSYGPLDQDAPLCWGGDDRRNCIYNLFQLGSRLYERGKTLTNRSC